MNVESPQSIVSVQYVSGWRRAYVFKIVASTGLSESSYFLKLAVKQTVEQKDYLRGEAAKTYRVHDAMHNFDQLRAVEPVAYFEDLACLIIRGVPGIRLDALIMEASRPFAGNAAYSRAERYCSLAAQWLAEFQKCVPRASPNVRTTAEAFLARAERELITLNLSAPARFTETSCRRHRDQFCSLIDQFVASDFIVSPRHSDFAPWNILCFERRIYVIDYADLTDGSLYEDTYQFADAMDVLSNRVLANAKTALKLKHAFIGECTVIGSASPSVTKYFTLLYRLIRTNAILNNSRPNVISAIRRRFLLGKYMQEISSGLAAVGNE